MSEENRRSLWENLHNYDKGFTRTYEEFSEDMKTPENRATLYQNLRKLEPKFTRTYEEFTDDIGFGNALYEGMTDEQLEALESDYLKEAEEVKQKAVAEAKEKEKKQENTLWGKMKEALRFANEASAPGADLRPTPKESDVLNSQPLDTSMNDYLAVRKELGRRSAERGYATQIASVEADMNRVAEKRDKDSDADLASAAYLLKKADEIYNSPNEFDGKEGASGLLQGVKNFGKGIKDNTFDRQFFATSDLQRNIRLSHLVSKLNSGEEMSDSEGEFLSAYITLCEAQHDRRNDSSLGYAIGQGVSMSIPFMVDMLITAGIGSLGIRTIVRTVERRAGTVAAARWAKWLGGAKGVNVGTAKAPRVLGNAETVGGREVGRYLTKEAAMTPLQTAAMPSAWAGVFDEKVQHLLETGETDWSFGDFTRSATNAMVETMTERAGGKLIDIGLGKVFKPINKIWGKKVGGTIFTNDFIQSPLGETAEEYLGAGVNYLRSFNPLYSDESNAQLRGEAEDMFTKRGFAQTFGTVLPMSLAGGAINMAGLYHSTVEYGKYRNQLREILIRSGANDKEADNIIAQSEGANDAVTFQQYMDTYYANLVELGKVSEAEIRSTLEGYIGAALRYNLSVNEFNANLHALSKDEQEQAKREMADSVKQMQGQMEKWGKKSETERQKEEKRSSEKDNKATPITEMTRIEQRDMDIIVDGKPMQITISGQGILNADGSIDFKNSRRVYVRQKDGTPIRRDDVQEAINAQLREERVTGNTIEDNVSEEEEQENNIPLSEEERAEAEAAAQAAAKETERQSVLSSLPKDKEGEVLVEKATPEQYFVYVADTEGMDSALSLAQEQIEYDKKQIKEIESNDKLSPKEKHSRAQRFKKEIAGYEAAIAKWGVEEQIKEKEELKNSPENLENQEKSITFAQAKDGKPTRLSINLTQNAGEDAAEGAHNRLDAQNEADRAAYKEALNTLRNEEATDEERTAAEETIQRIETQRKEQMTQLAQEALKGIEGVRLIGVEEGTGVYLNDGNEVIEYTSVVEVEVEEGNEAAAIAAMAAIAQVTKQDSYIVNYPTEGNTVYGVPESYKQDWQKPSPAAQVVVPLRKPLTQKQKAILTKAFVDAGLGVTITDKEISTSNFTFENYEEFYKVVDDILKTFNDGNAKTEIRDGRGLQSTEGESVVQGESGSRGDIQLLGEPIHRKNYSHYNEATQNGNDRDYTTVARTDSEWNRVGDQSLYEQEEGSSALRVPHTAISREDLLQRLQNVYDRTEEAMSSPDVVASEVNRSEEKVPQTQFAPEDIIDLRERKDIVILLHRTDAHFPLVRIAQMAEENGKTVYREIGSQEVLDVESGYWKPNERTETGVNEFGIPCQVVGFKGGDGKRGIPLRATTEMLTAINKQNVLRRDGKRITGNRGLQSVRIEKESVRQKLQKIKTFNAMFDEVLTKNGFAGERITLKDILQMKMRQVETTEADGSTTRKNISIWEQLVGRCAQIAQKSNAKLAEELGIKKSQEETDYLRDIMLKEVVENLKHLSEVWNRLAKSNQVNEVIKRHIDVIDEGLIAEYHKLRKDLFGKDTEGIDVVIPSVQKRDLQKKDANTVRYWQVVAEITRQAEDEHIDEVEALREKSETRRLSKEEEAVAAIPTTWNMDNAFDFPWNVTSRSYAAETVKKSIQKGTEQWIDEIKAIDSVERLRQKMRNLAQTKLYKEDKSAREAIDEAIEQQAYQLGIDGIAGLETLKAEPKDKGDIATDERIRELENNIEMIDAFLNGTTDDVNTEEAEKLRINREAIERELAYLRGEAEKKPTLQEQPTDRGEEQGQSDIERIGTLRTALEEAMENEDFDEVARLNAEIATLNKRIVEMQHRQKVMPNATPAQRFVTNVVLKALHNIRGITVHHATKADVERILARMNKGKAEMQGKSKAEPLSTTDGTVYGWSVGNEIWLTDEGMNPETPIHEYIHLFVKAMSQEDSKEWRRVVELCKKNKVLWDEVANDPNYAYLQKIGNEEKRDSAIASELLARYGGKRGAKRLEEKAAQMEQEGHSFESDVTAKLMVGRMKKALKTVYQWALDKLGIPRHYKSIDEVVDKGLYDLLSESDINTAAQSITQLNERFNQDLDRYIRNETPKGFRFELGMPSAYLTSAGFPNLPITLRSALLARKAGDTRHPFEADDIRDLVKAIQKPIAIFTYSKDNMRNLIVDTMHNGKHFLVGITLGYKSGELEVNSVSGLFPKESHEWVKWIQDGKAVRIDQKEKVQDLVNSLRTNPAESERIGLNLDLVAKIVQNFDNPKLLEENDVRLSIIGERGAANLDHAEEVTARMDNLQVARNMEQDGKDARTIRLATGWERGADHKWRYEIHDVIYSDKWKDKNRTAWNNMSPADRRALRYYQKFNYEMLSPVQRQNYNKLLDKLGYVIEERLTLKDVLVGRSADELFAAYPELKNVSFGFEGMGYAVKGFWSSENNKIRLSNNIQFNDKKINSVLNHEIQHAIQDIEGFAQGGNTESIQDLLVRAVNERNARYWADALRKKAEEIGEHNNLLAVEKAVEKEWIDEYQKQGLDYKEWMPDEETRKKGFDYFARGYADSSLDEAIKQLKFEEETNIDDSYIFEKYHSLAGEVEARNVQKRLHLDEWQRRKRLLAETEDVAREDQIFLLGENIVSGDVSFSIGDAEPYDYEAYPYGRVEPNLAEKEVEIVDANAHHGFANYNDARNWAKQNISKTYSNEQTGGKGDIRISNAAIDKFLSQSSVDKSDNKDVHLSVLKVLPDLLRTSIDVETHPDFLKGTDGKRAIGNEINKNVLVHRCYGAVSIDGVPYRVKITLKEDVRNSQLPHNTHSYEATKIELFAGTLVKPNGDNPNTNNSISTAKLLQNVGMSYNPSEKVLEKSRERTTELHTLTDQARREMRAIAEQAKADGTYMQAPNGKPTNLTERQWLQVRTKAFKKWFGDWEKAARIEKLRKSEPIVLTGEEYKGKYELNRHSAKQWIKDNLRGEYTIKDTGEKVSISRMSANELTAHGEREEIHLKSFAFVPEMIENAVFIEEQPNNKNNDKYDSYRYYAVGLKIDGVDYTARLVVGVKNGKTYYDHELTQIEKGTIIDSLNRTTNSVADKDNSLSDYKDKRLFSLLQTNSSKCVDENGEPKIVYRGSKNANSYVFHTRYDNACYWFTDNRSIAEHYARRGADHELSQEELNERVQPCFLNVRSSESVDAGGRTWQNVYEQPKYAIYDDETGHMTEFDTREEAEQYCKNVGLDPEVEIEETRGVTGDIAESRIRGGSDGMEFKNIVDGSKTDGTDIPSNIWVVKDNGQAKSAIDNIGTFDEDNADIRFQIVNDEGSIDAETILDENEPAPEEPVKRLNWFQRKVNQCLDQSNGIRLLMKRIGEIEGKPLPMDEDVREALESKRSKIANRLDRFTNHQGRHLQEALHDIKNSIKRTGLWAKGMTDYYVNSSGVRSERKLTLLNILEEYLMAKDTLERIGQGKPVRAEELAYRVAQRIDEKERGKEFDKQTQIAVLEKWVEFFESKIPAKEIKSLWSAVNECTHYILDALLDGGLIDKSVYDELSKSKYYVPERGFAQLESDEEIRASVTNREGKGVRTATPEALRRAKGGESMATDVLANILKIVTNAVVCAEENKVRQAAYRLLANHKEACMQLGYPMPKKVWYVRNGFDESGNPRYEASIENPSKELWEQNQAIWNLIRGYREDLETFKGDRNMQDYIRERIEEAKKELLIVQRRDAGDAMLSRAGLAGEDIPKVLVSVPNEEGDVTQYVMAFPNQREIANALNGIVSNRFSNKYFQSATRFFSSLFTTYNPLFWSRNLPKDALWAIHKGVAERGGAYSVFFAKEMARISTIAPIVEWVSHKDIDSVAATSDKTEPLRREFRRFLEGGGNTGYTQMKGIEDFRKEADRLVNGTNIGVAGLDFVFRKVPSALNEFSELWTRFSVYRATKDYLAFENQVIRTIGRSPSDWRRVTEYGSDEIEAMALHDARNITTNFNRNGAGANWVFDLLNSLSMFANAGIQGASGVWRTFEEGNYQKGVRGALSMMVIPALLGYILTRMTPDDDDEEKKIPDYIRQNNLVFLDKRVPLSYELIPWYRIGVNIALMEDNRLNKSDAIENIAMGIAEHTMPSPPLLNSAAKDLIDMAVPETDFSAEDPTVSKVIVNLMLVEFMRGFTELEQGKSWTGSNMRNVYAKDQPQWMFQDYEAELYKDLSKAIYRINGGDMKNPSITIDGRKMRESEDVSPRQLKNFIGSVTPNGWTKIACFAWGLSKELVLNDGEDYVRKNDVPIKSDFELDYNAELFRIGVSREMRAMTKEAKENYTRIAGLQDMSEEEAKRRIKQWDGLYKGYTELRAIDGGYSSEKTYKYRKELAKKYGVVLDKDVTIDEMKKAYILLMLQEEYDMKGIDKTVHSVEEWRSRYAR